MDADCTPMVSIHRAGQSIHDPCTSTTAVATVRLWVRLNSTRVAPSTTARSAALPLQCRVGRSPTSLRTSISCQLTPRLIPVPRAFAPASFAANRAAKLSAEFFFRKQYSISPAVNTRFKNRSPYRSILCCTRSISIMSVPTPSTMPHSPSPSSYTLPQNPNSKSSGSQLSLPRTFRHVTPVLLHPSRHRHHAPMNTLKTQQATQSSSIVHYRKSKRPAAIQHAISRYPEL